MNNNNYSEAIALLEGAETIAVFMHINPDPDCIGSALALASFLRNKGKKSIRFHSGYQNDIHDPGTRQVFTERIFAQ